MRLKYSENKILQDMKQTYIPPDYISKNEKRPLIFLAGPIRGSIDWQTQAKDILLRLSDQICIASPRRKIVTDFEVDFPAETYHEQVDWETYHLNRAAKNGVILFWLAKETNHGCERPYAQTTRFELAEWKTKHDFTGCKVAVGIEQGFTPERYIHHRLKTESPGIPVCTDLEDLCKKSVELALQKS